MAILPLGYLSSRYVAYTRASLDRLRRTVAVVVGNEIDLAAVDSAFGIDFREIRGFRLADHAIGRGRSAVRHGVADLDLAVARAGIVFLLGGGRSRGQSRERQGDYDRLPKLVQSPGFPPGSLLPRDAATTQR